MAHEEMTYERIMSRCLARVPGTVDKLSLIHISEGENKAIRKSCKKVIIDQKTRQRQEYTDQDLYNNKLVIACCVEPNFKDADWQAAKGVMGAEALLDKVLTAGQFSDLLMGVLRVNGFDDDINDLVDEAKN